MDGSPLLVELCRRIARNESFRHDAAVLNRMHLEAMLRVPKLAELSHEAVAKLLACAGHLAFSDDDADLLMAYKIAVQSHRLFGNEMEGLLGACEVVLSRLSNFIAIKLLTEKRGDDIPENAPLPLALEMADHIESNLVQSEAGSELLSDFQMRVWRALHDGLSVALAAPTSAGKSHVLEMYLKDAVRRKRTRVLFIVPTRALISQVERNLRKAFPSTEPLAPRIVTTPTPVSAAEGRSEIYVLTQERLHLLLEGAPQTTFDLAIVDEAQSIEDDQRGVLLAHVLQDVASKSAPQFIFSMPFVRNPGVLGSLLAIPDERLQSLKSSQQQVSQNYFVVSISGRTLTADSVDRSGKRTRISDASLSSAPGKVQYKRLAASAHALGDRSSLVYAPDPETAENAAEALAELMSTGDVDNELARKRSDLSAFLTEHIHRDYVVAKTVLNGAGCHYGPMPALARLSMERAFKEGTLTFLTTTATLLYGVNLPARDIFVLSPEKGNDALSPLEFWNLIGRAGRLSRELDGNVYLIDYDDWESKYLEQPPDRDITPAAIADVTERGAAFAEYIVSSEDTEVQQRPGFDGSMIRLIRAFRTGQLDEALSRLRASAATRQVIAGNIEAASRSIELPDEVLGSSPTLNPFRQRNLFRLISSKTHTRAEALRMMPIHPMRGGSKDRLREILQTCLKELEGRDDQQYKYLAAISWEWMRGSPLPVMIDTAHALDRRTRPTQKIGTTIRKVLKSIEKEIGYRCVRSIGCYNRILRFALDTRYPDLANSIVDIPLYLEFGASSGTMIACMTLGMSRISAVKVSSIINNPNWDPAQVLALLRTWSLARMGLSDVIVAEVEDVMQRNARPPVG